VRYFGRRVTKTGAAWSARCGAPQRLDKVRGDPHIRGSIAYPPYALPKAYLATKLAEPLPTTDGGGLRTIGDAISYMTALPKHREIKTAWQHACRLILKREPVEAITRQLSLALFTDAKLDQTRSRQGMNSSGQLILKRASASRPSGEWNDDDFDVVADGVAVGRIMNAAAAPVGSSWLWT
jgi:hypothetical protein